MIKKKSKFALYLEIKKQQRDCRKYFKTMKQELEIISECAADMA
jgi:hypothetical protein